MSFQTLLYRIAGYVRDALFTDAHSVLVAHTAETPEALVIGVDTVLGRLTGGEIKALTVAELQTLLGLDPNNQWITTGPTSVASTTAIVDTFTFTETYSTIGCGMFWTFFAMKDGTGKTCGGTIMAGYKDGSETLITEFNVYGPPLDAPVFSLEATEDPSKTITIELQVTTESSTWNVYVNRAPYNSHSIGVA